MTCYCAKIIVTDMNVDNPLSTRILRENVEKYNRGFGVEYCEYPDMCESQSKGNCVHGNSGG